MKTTVCDGGSVKEGNLTNSLCNTTQDGKAQMEGGESVNLFLKDLKVKAWGKKRGKKSLKYTNKMSRRPKAVKLTYFRNYEEKISSRNFDLFLFPKKSISVFNTLNWYFVYG